MKLSRTPVDNMLIDTTESLLERVTLPDFQRTEDIQHIQTIYQSLLEQYERDIEPQITGCMITVYCDGVYYLLDGNHRLQAYSKISSIILKYIRKKSKLVT